MKTFDFIKVTISHNLKGSHSKALEPDCLYPLLAVTIQSPRGESGGDDILLNAFVLIFNTWGLVP